MAIGYFNPNLDTPDSLAKRRQELDYLASRIGRAQNVGSGIGDMLSGLAVGLGKMRANSAERAGKAEGQKAWDSAFPSLFAPSPSASVAPSGTASAAPVNVPDSSTLPVPGAMKSAGGGSTGTWLAQQLQTDFGLSPGAAAGFAGNLAHESGNFKHLQEINPVVKGSRGGFGWAMWTGPRRRQFEAWSAANGLDPTSRGANYGFLKHELQNTPEGAVLARLKGVSDPAQAAQIVSDGYLRPGIPHMDSRIKFAQQIAGGMGNSAAPVQVASADPSFVPMPASAPAQESFVPNQQMGQQQRAMPEVPQQMAQAEPQPQMQPAQGANNERVMQLYKLMSNPWVGDDKKAMVSQLLQQELKKSDPAYQLEMQQNQLGLEKSQLEIDALRNPKPSKPEYITAKDGSVLAAGPDGSIRVVYGSQPDPIKPTADIQEYEYAKGQGFNGSFADYQTAIKKAGASQVNIDQKAEGAFDKKLAEGQAEAFNTMATEGMNARAEIGLVNQLEGLMQGQGGVGTGLAMAASKWGIATEGMSDLQAADAIINKLIPSQRQPGSGSMSDRDVEMFRASLPSLWNQPGGNAIIVQTMRGLAQYKQAQGDIAQRVQMGEMSRQDAVKALKELPNPLSQFAKPSQEGWKDLGGGVKIRKKQ